MIDFELKVFLGLYDKVVDKAVRDTSLPEQVKAEFISFSENKLQIPENITCVFITDKMSLLRPAVSLRKKNLRIVYCGHASDADKCLNKLEALWPAGESTEIVKKRFLILLKNLKNEFDCWFWKHTLMATINSIPDMLWYKRTDGIHTLVNDVFAETAQKPRKAIEGKDHFSIWNVPRHADGNAEFACAESDETAVRTGKTYICDEPVKTRDGMKRFTTYKTPLYDMYGNVFGTVGVAHDVTNFSNMGIELSILVENLHFPMVIFSADWKVVRMNNAFEVLSGCSGNQIENFQYHEWRDRTLQPVNRGADNVKKHSHFQEFKMDCHGEIRYFIVREQEIRDFSDNVSGYFLMMQEITYQRAYENSIIEAANTDVLTGLHNRRFFYKFLTQNAEKPMTLLYMDLDKFKAVNDNFGHARGDEVLIKTAQILTSQFPESVAIRLGGDEFALILEGSQLEKIPQRCARLEDTIRDTFSSDGLDVTVSIGIAETSGNLKNIDELIHASDTRMYAVKKAHHEGSF